MNRDLLQARLAELCGDRVPGAVVALTDGTSTTTVAHGVTSLRTRQPVTEDTAFQIGSISKVLTASLVMALVDRGDVHLDEPVRSYLPDFAVADPEATRTITVRHLLNHTAGLEGDVFTDTGRGDDALRVYVEQLAGVGQVHPVGQMFSYCNSGFSVLGHLAATVNGTTWDQALREHVSTPLGSTTLSTTADEVVLQPHAVGHLDLPGPDGEKVLQVTPVFALPRATGPAGSVMGTAADLLASARAHVPGSGAALLDEASVAAMQSEEVVLDDPWPLGRAWGLGWILPVPGVVGHDGATYGQYAFLRLHPQTGVAMVLLTNGPGARPVFEGLFAEFFDPLAGVTLPVTATPADAPPAVEQHRWVGTYERQETRLEVVAREDGDVDLTLTNLGPTAALVPGWTQRLTGFEADTLISAAPAGAGGTHLTVKAIGTRADGTAEWLHVGARATPRTA